MSAKPSIALCIFGQLRDDHIHFPSISKLAAALEADVFISTWRRRGTKTSGVMNRDQIIRMFGIETGTALPAPLVGDTRFGEAVPAFEPTLLASFGSNEVTAEQLHASFPGAVVDIEDEVMALDFAAPVPSDRNSLRMLYKIWRCNELKRAAEKRRGSLYDIVVHIRPDIMPDLTFESFAPLLAPDAPPTVLIHGGTPTGTHLSDVMAVATSPVANTVSGLFGRAVMHPARKWDFIHAELPRYLREHGITVGGVGLKAWVAEDYKTSQPRNRRHLLALLSAGQVNTGYLPRPESWQSVLHLVRAGADLDDKRNRAAMERHIAQIDLAGEDADFIAGIAFLLCRAHRHAREIAGAYAALLVRLYCRISATAGACLKEPATTEDIEWLHKAGSEMGVTEPLSWRSVARHLLPAHSAEMLLRLAQAAQSAMGFSAVLAAERALRTAHPARFPAWPGGDAELDETLAQIAARDMAGAQASLHRAATTDPASPLPLAMLGDLLLAAGALPDSARAYGAAAAMQGSGADMRAMVGEVLRRAGQQEPALVAAGAAMQAAPANSFLAARVADLLAQAGRHGEAAKTWQLVLQRSPHDIAAHRALARSLAHLGQVAEARDLLAKAHAALPDDDALRAELAALAPAAPDPAPEPAPAPVAQPKPAATPAPAARLQAVAAPVIEDPQGERAPAPPAADFSPAWQVLMGAAPPAKPETEPPPAPPERTGLFRRFLGKRS
jgi:Flp pilus assembly protein TadD